MNKQRLSITLSQSTLSQIDQLIDKKKVRSRSHAIETLLQKQLKPDVATAVILAGGKTSNPKTIKPLLTYQKKPLIFHIIDHLRDFGVSQFVILTSAQAKSLSTILKKKYPNLSIKYRYEKDPLGTAGALKSAKELLNESFYCFHGDVFTDINLHELASFHYQHQGVCTIAVKPRMSHQSFDNISAQGNKVIAFQPKDNSQRPSLVNSGIYLFEPEIFDHIPDKKPSMLEKDVFPKLASTNQLFAFTFEGIWLDITTEKKYQQDFHKQINTN